MSTATGTPSEVNITASVPILSVPPRASSSESSHQSIPIDSGCPAPSTKHSLDELLALLKEVQLADDLSQSWKRLCDDLRQAANCERVALGIANHRGSCRIVAISNMVRIDRRSELVLATEAAMDEAIRGDGISVWNAFGTEQPPIFHRLARLATADAMASVPLRNAAGTSVGAMMFFGKREWINAPADLEWLTKWQQPLANFINLLNQARGNFYCRLWTAVNKLRHRFRRRLLMAAFAVAASVLALPIPYKVKCECSVEPVLRRFVVAPFAGTLDKTFVEVGEVVHAGQVLAAMDQRELHWELSGLDAEHAAAKKKRDSALANQDGSAVQLATLEIERLNTKIQTLRKRVEHLQVQCPIDGIVVSGDLKRTEGAPLTIGQTLFEIAPLERMIAELKVPQEEIAHLREGASVDLQLDAFPRQIWSGTIAKIHPRAELCDGYTGFIAEVLLDNVDGSLRPGMSGRAKIKTPSRSLGWIYFHRPVNAFAQRIGW